MYERKRVIGLKKSKKILIISLSVGAALLVTLTGVLIYLGTSDIVTFDLDGGSIGTMEMRVWNGKEYTLPVPIKDGYAFAGWYFGSMYVSLTGIWELNGDVTLKAKWEIVDALGLMYRKVENGYIIEGYKGEIKELIIIPDKFNNAPVVGVDDDAFEHIEKNISNSPNGYVKVLLPSSAVSSEYLSRFGKKLMVNRYSAIGEDGLIYLENEKDVSIVGYNGSYINDIMIPEMHNGKPVKSIDSYTFFGSMFHIDDDRTESLEPFLKVLIPLNVENVGYGAFSYCKGMKVRLYRLADEEPVEIYKRETGDCVAQLDWILKANISEGNENFAQIICVISPSFGWGEFNNATYFIRLNANGGQISKSAIELKKKAKYDLPTPEREGYAFDGWYNGDTLVPQQGEMLPFNTHVELTAKWTEIQKEG